MDSAASSSPTAGLACFITNEARWLQEWIEFHRLIGFSRFLFFDNESNDSPETALQPYLDTGIATLIRWPNRYGVTRFHRSQLDAYNEAIRRCRGVVDWLAILDADEFLFPAKANRIQEVLASLPHCSGLVVNWQTFGTSGVDDLNAGEYLIEKLTWKRRSDHPGNAHVKSIFRPECVLEMATQHHCRYRPGAGAVNTGGERVDGPHSLPVRWDPLRINHYLFRTERYFREQKVPMMQRSGRYAKRQAVLEDSATFRAEQDTVIHRFLPALKSATRG